MKPVDNYFYFRRAIMILRDYPSRSMDKRDLTPTDSAMTPGLGKSNGLDLDFCRSVIWKKRQNKNNADDVSSCF